VYAISLTLDVSMELSALHVFHIYEALKKSIWNAWSWM